MDFFVHFFQLTAKMAGKCRSTFIIVKENYLMECVNKMFLFLYRPEIAAKPFHLLGGQEIESPTGFAYPEK